MKKSAALSILVALALAGAAGAAEDVPDWWDSQIGTAPIVLPGFAPVRADGLRVELWGRSYIWDRGFLPARIESLGRRLTGPVELVAKVGSERVVLEAEKVEIVEAHADHVTVRATGTPIPGLSIDCTTRVEYDGVAMVTLTLTPQSPVEIGGLDNQVSIVRNDWSRGVAFQATPNPGSSDNARMVMKKPALVRTDLRGPFRNVLGFPDGDRSFWWFADNAEGWIWNGKTVTEVLERPGEFLLRQRLIGESWRIEKPMVFRFNFLATPVRDLGSAWRSQRVTARPPENSGEVGAYNYWWPDALAHPVLPYTAVPPEIRAAYPGEDWNSSPKRGEVRNSMRAYKAKGFQRLPYFSSHCLAIFDPVFRRYRKEWEVDPPWVAHWGKTETPCSSHRAQGYSNYLLHRISAVIDEIEMPGIYFDQGGVLDSRNPAHGAWTDSNGNTQASLEILAYREFLKRLRVLFFEKGRPGTVVTHNSGSQVIPALTFVSSNLDGEQFRQPGRLRNDDYIESVSLDEMRSLYAGGQFGVLNAWLPAPWALHSNDPNWEGSTAQFRAHRSLMTQALLHDFHIVPAGVAREDYDALVQRLDRFGVGDSEFIGYWNDRRSVRAAQTDAPVSYYRRKDGKGALLVIANLHAAKRVIRVVADPAKLGLVGDSFAVVIAPSSAKPLLPGGDVHVAIPRRDFALVEIRSIE